MKRAMHNIGVHTTAEGNVIVNINGQEISAEAFMATPCEELGITYEDAWWIEDEIEKRI